MTIIDSIGIGTLVLLVLILLVCLVSETKSYLHIKNNWEIIQHNISTHGINLKQDGLNFYYVSSTHKSRILYPSEVLSFWYRCENGTKFEENTLPL